MKKLIILGLVIIMISIYAFAELGIEKPDVKKGDYTINVGKKLQMSKNNIPLDIELIGINSAEGYAVVSINGEKRRVYKDTELEEYDIIIDEISPNIQKMTPNPIVKFEIK